MAAQRVKKTNAVIGKAGVARIAEIEREMTSAPDNRITALCHERMRLIFRAYLNDVGALERMRTRCWDASPAALRHELLASDAASTSLGNWDFLPDLAKLQQPALVVEGADTHVLLEATRAWATALPKGRLLVVPGTSHIVWLGGDVPRLRQALNRFLSGQGWPEGAEGMRR